MNKYIIYGLILSSLVGTITVQRHIIKSKDIALSTMHSENEAYLSVIHKRDNEDKKLTAAFDNLNKKQAEASEYFEDIEKTLNYAYDGDWNDKKVPGYVSCYIDCMQRNDDLKSCNCMRKQNNHGLP